MQEIIKVREWIPQLGPLTKVIRLKDARKGLVFVKQWKITKKGI